VSYINPLIGPVHPGFLAIRHIQAIKDLSIGVLRMMIRNIFMASSAGRMLATLSMSAALGLFAANCPGQSATPNLPAGVQDVVKMVKAGLNEDVVVAQIKHLGSGYNLSVDQIINLHDQGVTQNEIAALIANSTTASPSAPPSAPAAAPAPTPPPTPTATATPQNAPLVPTASPGAYIPPQEPAVAPPAAAGPPGAEPASLDAFRAQLSPYGAWMDVPGYGLCWRPSVERSDPFWRPYCDQGHWVYTNDGWTWQSEYPWGETVFHYGRWYRDSLGWAWVPGYDWAPAWVCWRQSEGYCGWAPLPPGAAFKVGVGLWFGGRAAVDVDFGLGADAFTFVPYDHFWDYHLHEYMLPRERLRLVFGRSYIMNGYRLDHGRFIVEGLGRDHMAALTHHEIRVEHAIAHDRGRRGPDHGYHDDRRDRHGH
jgi:hypothetical protein